VLFANRSIADIIATAIIALIGMTIHEFAHNYVGYRMGDPTPRDQGKLTLNPAAHIYWVGWLMWAVIGFGILGSAPISEYRMRDRRWGYFWAVAAGPLSNLALAAVFAGLLRLGLSLNLWDFSDILIGPRDFVPTLPQLIYTGVWLNVLLFLFNLLPFFPFDGWHMVRKLLPPQQAYVWERYQQQSMIVFFAIFLIDFATPLNIIGGVLLQPAQQIMRILLGL
jgi:Zn-dependent protease